MVGIKELAKANQDISVEQQRALVSGGTQGIGAGIALRFARAGAQVWIIGRNEQKAEEVLAQLRKASADHAAQRGSASAGPGPQHEFFKADLSDPAEMDRVAAEITKRAGEAGIDHLIETQGGPPTGVFKPTANSEFAFSVQCLSRFRVAERLLQAGTVKRSVLIVAVPGLGGKTLDVDDIDFRKSYHAGRWWGPPIGLGRMAMRDSAVLDCIAQSFAEKYPKHNIIHLQPGFIATNAVENVGFPWPMPWLARTFGPLIFPTPNTYADLPFYLLTNPAATSVLRSGEMNGFGPWLWRYKPSGCAQDAATREKLWERLQGFFKSS
ncbi:hypothetical protein V8E36_000237 [Tilletia maclaganii]